MHVAVTTTLRSTISAFTIVFVCAPATFAAPPKVVEAVPDNGDTTVDPALQELRVTFDRDMRQRGFSWCGGGTFFPEVTGKPYWDGARTCVLPVKLVPGHEYRLSINCPAAQNFRSSDGVPAEAYPITFRTRSNDAGAAPAEDRVTPADQEIAAQALRRAVRQHYSYRDLRGVDWDAEYSKYLPKLEKAETAAGFARIAAELLKCAGDIHMWVEHDGIRISTARRNVPPNCPAQRLTERVKRWRDEGDCVAWGRIDRDTGYLLIDSWGSRCGTSLDSIFRALWEMSDCASLIIDVRRNAGGDEGLAQQVAGCFVDEPAIYAKHVFCDPNEPGGFSPVRERQLRPNKVRSKYRGRVIVLSGRHVMSSCEAFVLMMKQVPGCTIVGDTTYGSSGNPRPHRLPNGVTVYLPSWKAMTPDGKCFEGQGIPPDVELKTTPEDFAGGADPVLEKALEVLRK